MEFVPPPGRLTAKDSTSRAGAGSIAATRADYAESNPRPADALRCAMPARSRCSRRKGQWDDRQLRVATRRTQPSPRARSVSTAPDQCCRRIQDNSFPKFLWRGHSTSRLLPRPSDRPDPRYHKIAARRFRGGQVVERDANAPSTVLLHRSRTARFFELRRAHQSPASTETGSVDQAN